MDILYSPWRGEFVEQEVRTKHEKATEEECVFCQQLLQDDDESFFILKRGKFFSVMLNRFPYNAGHLLIVSLKHISSLGDLSSEGRCELVELTHKSIIVLQEALKPEGMNIGLNLGKASGASIPTHLHQHVLPRWLRDTNFLTVLAQTKVISFDLKEVYKKLKAAFESVS